MSRSGFKLDRKGVRELLTSEEMAAVIREYSDQVLSNAGGATAGYGMNVQTAKRAVGRVYCRDAAGYADNSENNTLLKALQGGGDD